MMHPTFIDPSMCMVWRSEADKIVDRVQGHGGDYQIGECVVVDVPGNSMSAAVVSIVAEHFIMMLIGPSLTIQPALAKRWLTGES